MPVKLGSAASAVRKVAWPCVLLLEPFRDSLENKKKNTSEERSANIYSRINTIKSPASGAGKVSESRLASHVRRVRETVCA